MPRKEGGLYGYLLRAYAGYSRTHGLCSEAVPGWRWGVPGETVACVWRVCRHTTAWRRISQSPIFFLFAVTCAVCQCAFWWGTVEQYIYIYLMYIYIYMYFILFSMFFDGFHFSLQMSRLSRHISSCCLFCVKGLVFAKSVRDLLFRWRRTYYILRDFWKALRERFERIIDCLLKSI